MAPVPTRAFRSPASEGYQPSLCGRIRWRDRHRRQQAGFRSANVGSGSFATDSVRAENRPMSASPRNRTQSQCTAISRDGPKPDSVRFCYGPLCAQGARFNARSADGPRASSYFTRFRTIAAGAVGHIPAGSADSYELCLFNHLDSDPVRALNGADC